MAGRLGYIDWMRGLAVLLMMQTHAYDSWLSPAAKTTAFYRWSRLLGGYPAPLFLFLAGLSLALLVEARLARGRTASAAAGEGARRGLEVLGYAALFRAFLLVTSGFARPADLLRVDVLNCIGLGMLATAGLALRWSSRTARQAACLGLGAAVALLTPLAWDTPWPAAIPRPLLGYVSGRVLDSFFPLFPWLAYLAIGAAVGSLLQRAHGAGREGALVVALTGAGAVSIPVALALDSLPQAYPRYDFWWTSPNYVLIKIGILLLALGLAYLWQRLPWGTWPSLLRQLGRTSLLVYWVHIEIVYGGLLLPGLRHRLEVVTASSGLALLTLGMLLLSLARTSFSKGALWSRLTILKPPAAQADLPHDRGPRAV